MKNAQIKVNGDTKNGFFLYVVVFVQTWKNTGRKTCHNCKVFSDLDKAVNYVRSKGYLIGEMEFDKYVSQYKTNKFAGEVLETTSHFEIDTVYFDKGEIAFD